MVASVLLLYVLSQLSKGLSIHVEAQTSLVDLGPPHPLHEGPRETLVPGCIPEALENPLLLSLGYSEGLRTWCLHSTRYSVAPQHSGALLRGKQAHSGLAVKILALPLTCM